MHCAHTECSRSFSFRRNRVVIYKRASSALIRPPTRARPAVAVVGWYITFWRDRRLIYTVRAFGPKTYYDTVCSWEQLRRRLFKWCIRGVVLTPWVSCRVRGCTRKKTGSCCGCRRLLADASPDYDTFRFVPFGEKNDLLVVEENIEQRRPQAQEVQEAQKQTNRYRRYRHWFEFFSPRNIYIYISVLNRTLHFSKNMKYVVIG